MDCLRTSLAPFAIVLGAWPLVVALDAQALLAGDGPPDVVAGIPGSGGENSADGPQKPAEPSLGKYITVTSPVDDLVFGRVKNAVLNLESQAQQQHRRAVLILEITHGTTPFHQAYGLAKFLTSAEIA